MAITRSRRCRMVLAGWDRPEPEPETIRERRERVIEAWRLAEISSEDVTVELHDLARMSGLKVA
jgi:hypothetical protein